MRVLQLLLLLAAVLHNLQPGAAMHTPPSVHTDSHMGIRVYSFPLQVPKVEPGAYELRVYLRTICESSKNSSRPDEVLIKGFAGAFPVTGSVPAGVSLFSPHFQPPALRQHMLHITSSGPGGSSSSSTTLKWLGPANQGLWRLDGPLRPTGREMLSLEGSTQEHQLVLSCGGGSAAGLAAQHRASAFPTRGLWNVVTTTSANRLPPDTLAHLLMLHLQYHERLGFDGAILRCNKGEAQALVMLPHIEVLVAARKLVIWPWVSSKALTLPRHVTPAWHVMLDACCWHTLGGCTALLPLLPLYCCCCRRCMSTARATHRSTGRSRATSSRCWRRTATVP
jgi:hypothetical protein